jgi:O-antigen/teichoic acid export membrane protein
LEKAGWRGRFAAACNSDLVGMVSQTYATQIANVILGLATTILIARSLGAEGRGLYAVALSVGALGVQFSNLGLHASNTYYVARNNNLLPALLGNSLLISWGVGGSVALLGWIGFRYWPGIAPVPGRLLALSLLWIPLGLSFLLTENLLLGLREIRAFNGVELLNRLLGMSLVAVVVGVGHANPERVFAASLAALVISSARSFWVVAKRTVIHPRLSFALVRDNFRIGVKAYVLTLLSFLVIRIDLLMVKYMLGAEPAGYYSVAASLADLCLLLPTTVGTVLFPRLTSMSDAHQKLKLTRKAGLITAAALFPMLLAAGILAKPVITLAFGKAFHPSADAFLWLLPGIFTLGVQVVIVQFLNSLGYPRILMGVWGVSTAINILANLWAIPTFGIAGASMVSSLSYTLTFLLVLLLIVKRWKAEVA